MTYIDDKVFVFYFDIIGIKRMLADDLEATVKALDGFQRHVRERMSALAPGGQLVTVADNVIARIVDADRQALADVITHTVTAADEHGFKKFFGVVTFGVWHHPARGELGFPGANEPSRVHLSFLSDPYLRAMVAEKVSASLARKKKNPAPAPSIWVSEEVDKTLFSFRETTWGGEFDVEELVGDDWRFEQSKFTPLVFIDE